MGTESTQTIGQLRERVAWLEGTAMPHARKQENANGFQKGWHAALSRISEGESADALAALVPQPKADVDDTLPWPVQLPVWKCRACGCLWRDNLDDTVSLLNPEQRSCGSCEHSPTRTACAIHWLPVEVARADPARFTDSESGKACGSATDRLSSSLDPSAVSRPRGSEERG